jgi:hypothetical protein
MNIIEIGMLVYLRLLLVLEFLKINGKFQWGQEVFPFSRMPSLSLGPTRPPFQWVPGFLRGLMRLACDVNPSPQSGAKVKNE